MLCVWVLLDEVGFGDLVGCECRRDGWWQWWWVGIHGEVEGRGGDVIGLEFHGGKGGGYMEIWTDDSQG